MEYQSVDSKKQKILYISLGFLVFLLLWAFWFRNYLVTIMGKNLISAAIFYYLAQYAVIFYLFVAQKAKFRKIILFIMVGIMLNDLVFGFPFLYGTKGLEGQSLNNGGLYSEDAIFGMSLEHSLFKCSSYQEATYSKGLPICGKGVTWFIFILLNLLIPVLIVVITLFMFLGASKREMNEMVEAVR